MADPTCSLGHPITPPNTRTITRGSRAGSLDCWSCHRVRQTMGRAITDAMPAARFRQLADEVHRLLLAGVYDDQTGE